MDNYFTLDPLSNEMTARRLPVENLDETQRYDQLGLLDANYHGSAQLLMKLCRNNWFKMDVFALDRFLEMPLIPYCLHLFCDVWSLNRGVAGEPPLITDIVQLVRLARTISEKYSCTNYYHTILHGIDVAHSFSCLLISARKKGILKLDSHQYLVALLSALMHDIDHPGVTYDYFYDKNIENFFKSKNLVASESPLTNEASLTSYTHRQRMSIGTKRYLHSLESHQASMAVSVLLVSGVISNQSESQQRKLCHLMTDLIESTDMNLHRSMSTEMAQLVNLFKDSTPVEMSSSDRVMLLCFMLKCSDTSNPAKIWDYYYTWSRLITAEFFAQGDKERYIRGCLNSNKFVTHFCDRNLVKFELSQIGFIKFIRESFNQLDSILQCRLTREIMIQLDRNLRYLLMIRDVKQFNSSVEAKRQSVKLRVTLMLRELSESQLPSQKLKCCVLLCNRERSLGSTGAERYSIINDRIQLIF